LKVYQEKQERKFRIYEEVEPDEALEMMREATKKPDSYEIYNKSLLKKLSSKNAADLNGSQIKGDYLSKSVIHNRNYQKKLLENVSMSLIMNESTEANARNNSIEFVGSDKGDQ